MAVSNTKLKILHLLKILLEKTDENHIMSSADLIKALNAYGYTVDRKSIYSDIETLMEFGIDIVQAKGGAKQGYYVGSRDFELPEVKLLVDAVQSSKFITAKKSRELIGKIEKLVSENEAKQLQRNVFIFNRIKTENETIYYNVDCIHSAISANRQIKFQYSEWNIEKELAPKKGGQYYIVSPWELTWDDENYYLIAYEETSDKIKHYRVDKMRNTAELDQQRMGKNQFVDFDLASYAKKTFNMYGGKERKVSLVCDNSMIGVMIDRFSQEITVVREDEEHFRINVDIFISPQFFGWITGLGTGVRIDGPLDVKKDYKVFLENVLSKYD